MKNKLIISVTAVLLMALLAACSNAAISLDSQTTATVIQMQMSSSYDSADPFINEKLIFISDDIEKADFETSFQMTAESGLLEIADNKTKEVIWSKAWKDYANEKFSFTLSGLNKEKEYVIRLTCTKTEDVQLIMISDSNLVKEREKPSDSSWVKEREKPSKPFDPE